MKVIIVEDEGLAVERLEQLLGQYDDQIQVLGCFDSVAETVAWLAQNEPPDLAFFDIQLADGLSFEIFERAEVTCPVIFTTAYDAYALRAFKVNSIDYLLKPIDLEDLAGAMEQYRRLRTAFGASEQSVNIEAVRQALAEMQQRPNYKTRFIVKAGEHLATVPVADVSFFYSEHKTVWLRRRSNGNKHAIDYTLEQLESLLDPAHFFRLNRKYYTGIDAIDEVVTFSNSRLRVYLKGVEREERILVSREKVAAFKAWLDR